MNKFLPFIGLLFVLHSFEGIGQSNEFVNRNEDSTYLSSVYGDAFYEMGYKNVLIKNYYTTGTTLSIFDCLGNIDTTFMIAAGSDSVMIQIAKSSKINDSILILTGTYSDYSSIPFSEGILLIKLNVNDYSFNNTATNFGSIIDISFLENEILISGYESDYTVIFSFDNDLNVKWHKKYHILDIDSIYPTPAYVYGIEKDSANNYILLCDFFDMSLIQLDSIGNHIQSNSFSTYYKFPNLETIKNHNGNFYVGGTMLESDPYYYFGVSYLYKFDASLNFVDQYSFKCTAIDMEEESITDVIELSNDELLLVTNSAGMLTNTNYVKAGGTTGLIYFNTTTNSVDSSLMFYTTLTSDSIASNIYKSINFDDSLLYVAGASYQFHDSIEIWQTPSTYTFGKFNPYEHANCLNTQVNYYVNAPFTVVDRPDIEPYYFIEDTSSVLFDTISIVLIPSANSIYSNCSIYIEGTCPIPPSPAPAPGLPPYPNPSAGIFNYDLLGFYNYQIIDLSGATILSGTFTDHLSFDISASPSGPYQLIITDSYGFSVTYIIIKV